ncbi:hypothetical protein SBA4_2370004 [Candidatus Sulfopaludibacter sp. SbA4]|nr:hypothetical protein SBA4_2370004 [Candidatus Sulfopaludibacter sp. SbA4]
MRLDGSNLHTNVRTSLGSVVYLASLIPSE